MNKNKASRQEYYKKNSTKLKKNLYEKRRKNRKWLDNYKKLKVCGFCGEKETYCLDFHHVNPDEKESDIMSMVRNCYSIERMQREIDKCVLVCANCHRKVHHGLLNIKDFKY